MKQRSLPLPKLLRFNRNAATVFLAVLYLSEGKRQIGVTRGRISAVCGLSQRVIGEAIEALDAAGWLKRRYGRAGNRAWYRLGLPAVDLRPVVGFRPVCRKTTHREASGTSKNDTQGSGPCGTKNDTHPLEGIGAVPAAALIGASAPAHKPHEDPAAKIERKRMEEIQAARLARRRQEGGGNPC